MAGRKIGGFPDRQIRQGGSEVFTKPGFHGTAGSPALVAVRQSRHIQALELGP